MEYFWVYTNQPNNLSMLFNPLKVSPTKEVAAFKLTIMTTNKESIIRSQEGHFIYIL